MSMTRLYKYFFRGLITVLRLALTIYLLYIFLAWTEAVALTFLRPFIGATIWAASSRRTRTEFGSSERST